jgi:hypothetical protein
MRGPPFVGNLLVALGICMLLLSIGVGVDQAMGCVGCDVSDCSAADPDLGCPAICNTPPGMFCYSECSCGVDWGSSGAFCRCSHTW